MKLKDMNKEELELLSYTDLTYMLLSEGKKTMNTPTIFRQISDLLEYSDEEYTSKIGDFYTSLNIDKRFVLLPNNDWDIRDHHSIEITLDDDEESVEEMIPSESEELEELPEEEEENIDTLDDDDSLDDDDDDLSSLSIIDDEEEEEE